MFYIYIIYIIKKQKKSFIKKKKKRLASSCPLTLPIPQGFFRPFLFLQHTGSYPSGDPQNHTLSQRG